MMKKIILGGSVLIAVCLATYFGMERYVATFPPAYKEACESVFGESLRPLHTFKEATRQLPISSYADCTDVIIDNDSVVWEFTDDNYRRLTIALTASGKKYVAEAAYTTLRETADEIASIVKLMFGPDISYTISDKTVNGLTIVNVQGNEYRWKDGTLERMR